MFCFGNWLVSIKREGPREAGIDAKIIPWKEIRGTARRPPLLLLWGPAEGHLIWEIEEKGNRALLGYQGWGGTRTSTRSWVSFQRHLWQWLGQQSQCTHHLFPTRK